MSSLAFCNPQLGGDRCPAREVDDRIAGIAVAQSEGADNRRSSAEPFVSASGSSLREPISSFV